MQTVTNGWWRWRLVHALGRNPLVRTSDRIEVTIAAMAIAAVLVAIPVAAAMATAIHDERGHAYAAQAERHLQVHATVTQASATLPRTNVSVVEATWSLGGVERVGRFQWDQPVRAGQSIEIVVDENGERVVPLDPWWRAGLDGTIAAITFWLAVAAAAAGCVAVSRPCLRRVRYAAWDRDIASLADDGGTADRHP
ncbi:hypothetical protein H7J88_01810 [Mycolicibacterium flavescens]|uniref:Transmembrane protein n=1 Tax=Mycolicibacterium flavescens TaxID=1776 RepID=A0A1E3REJ8_MYCFV|nr:hypothetical protein [Mycolicibacterium flavescens]MCV7278380.1 hypothetical protein [Mycolicibacterium flavescens]ODQ87827.1 hypothetical protein BHQ18_22515 [Mycolicibacterium flavescens]